MTDPLSIIAVGAAVGGFASKVAEKAWDSGELWLREKFGSHIAEAKEQARENVAKFVRQLAIRVAELEKQQAIEQKKLTKSLQQPHFSALLQQTILNAAKTNNDEKLDLLARLVSIRLVSDDETTVSLASDLASDAITRSTRSQLELMALCCFLDEIRPKDPLQTEADYHSWLSIHLKPFENYEFEKVDARHLVSIACASFDPASNRSLSSIYIFKGATKVLGKLHKDNVTNNPLVNLLQFDWDEGLAGVQLTSVGSIVGGLALGQIYGKDMGLPDWE